MNKRVSTTTITLTEEDARLLLSIIHRAGADLECEDDCGDESIAYEAMHRRIARAIKRLNAKGGSA